MLQGARLSICWKHFPAPGIPYHMALAACGICAISRPQSTAGNVAYPTPTQGSCILQGLGQPHLPKEEEGKQEREASPHPGLEALCKG